MLLFLLLPSPAPVRVNVVIPAPIPGLIPVSLLVDIPAVLVRGCSLWRDSLPFVHCFPFHWWLIFSSRVSNSRFTVGQMFRILGYYRGFLIFLTFPDSHDVRKHAGIIFPVLQHRRVCGRQNGLRNKPLSLRKQPRTVKKPATESSVAQGGPESETLLFPD